MSENKELKREYERVLNEKISKLLADPNVIVLGFNEFNGRLRLVGTMPYDELLIARKLSHTEMVYLCSMKDSELRHKILYPELIPISQGETAVDILPESRRAALFEQIRPKKESKNEYDYSWLRHFNGESFRLFQSKIGIFKDTIEIESIFKTEEGVVTHTPTENDLARNWYPTLNYKNVRALKKLLNSQYIARECLAGPGLEKKDAAMYKNISNFLKTNQ